MTKPCLAVIPARGGSKGIPKKNIQCVGDKPLLCYAIDSILDSDIGVDIVVSTDSDEIAQVAIDHGGAYVIKRPKSISGDGAKTEDALLDALDQMESLYGKTYEVVLTVQPTSPFRKPETVKRFWNEFIEISNEYDAMLTLNETR
jgi:CMP-N,N'-diacetyllegionaminic acid synthase